MRVGIFYLSHRPAWDRVTLPLPRGGMVYLRMEEVEAEDESAAMDHAKLREDETLMNTHELPEREV